MLNQSVDAIDDDEQGVLGKVTFKSNALQYCITPQG